MQNDLETAERANREKNKAAGFRVFNLRSRVTENKAVSTALELAQIHDGERVLEVAAGTGFFFKEVLKRNPGGTNIALYLSRHRLRRAIRRFRRRNIKPAFVLGSAPDLPFQSDQFDLLINNYLLDLLPDEMAPQVLSEFKRVLRPESRVVITTMAFGEKWFHRVWGGLAKWAPGLLTGCRPVAMAPHLRAAGFSNIEVIEISQNTFPSEVLTAELRV